MIKKLNLVKSAVVLALCGTMTSLPSCTSDIDNPAPVVVDDKPFDAYKYIDTSVRPGDDFFGYTSGLWLSNPDLHGLFDIAQSKMYDLRDQCVYNSTDMLVSTFRQLISDADSYYTADMELLQSRLDMLSAITTQAELESAITQLQQWGYPVLFRLYGQDISGCIAPLIISEKPLPDAEFAFQMRDPEMLPIAVDNVCYELSAMGFSRERIAEIRQHAVEVETLELNAYDQGYHYYYVRTDHPRHRNLTRGAAPTSYQKVFQLMGIGDKAHLYVEDSDEECMPLVNLLQAGTDESIATLRDYLIYYVFGQDMLFIPQLTPYVNNDMRLRYVLEFAIYHTNRILGETYGHYVQKEKCSQMMEEIRQVFIEHIEKLDWMTATTKQQALKNLRAIKFLIGYPDQWNDEFEPVIEGSTLLEALSSLRSQTAGFARQIIGRDMQTHSWDLIYNFIPFSYFNAYFLYNSNMVVILPAVVMPPLLDPDQSEATHYALAVAFAHEMCHGFDGSNAYTDEYGVKCNWWSDEDRATLDQKKKQMVTLWNQLEAYPGQPADGEKTLYEDMADLGGVTLALDAYKRRLRAQGFYGEQFDEQLRKFLLSYVSFFGQNDFERSPVLLNWFYLYADHSAGHNRVNGIVRLIDDWYRLYDVKPTDKLYLAPEDRIKIW